MNESSGMQRLVSALLERLNAPHHFRPDGLLEVEIPAELAQELTGPMARPEGVLLAFDEARASQTDGAEWLTPASARFREWMQLLRRRGRIARLTATPLGTEPTIPSKRNPLMPVLFEPWLSIGFTFTPFSGDNASGQHIEEWLVNLVTGESIRCDLPEIARRVKDRLAAALGASSAPPLDWRPGLPPEGSAISRRRLSMRRAYQFICLEIVRQASVAATDAAPEANGQTEATAASEVRVRPYRTAVLYLPRPSDPRPSYAAP